MTFMDSFLLAQANLACNRSEGFGDRYDDATGATCIQSNPLLAALIAGEASRLRRRTALIDALDFNSPGQFVHRLTQVETSRPTSGQGRIRGGSFWGAVLAGRFPLNFFQANPFVASARGLVNDGFSKYNGLEIEVNRRFSDGLALQANYTFQKALADFDGDQNTLINDTRPSSVNNPTYTTQQYVPKHVINANWIYELPFGSGRRFAMGDGLADRFLGGWQFGGILNWRSGRPLSITSGVGTFHRTAVSDANTVDLSQPVDRGALQDLVGQRTIAGGVFWLDPCLSSQLGQTCSDPNAIQGLFQLPDSGQLGELGQTVIFGPRRFTLDFNLSKRTKINDDAELEFPLGGFQRLQTTRTSRSPAPTSSAPASVRSPTQ